MKNTILPVALCAASLFSAACTKNYYYTAPVRTVRTQSAPVKAPANVSPAVDGFQAVTKPTSYSSY
ncbi:MAG: hypothetical protein ACKOHM_07610 [Spartobacteria bacterium]